MKERSGFNEAGVRRVFQPVLRAFKVGTDTFITMNERVDRAIASRDPDEIRTTMSILLSKTFGAPDRVMSALEAALVSDAPKYTEENAVIRQVKEYFATENGRLAEVVRSRIANFAELELLLRVPVKTTFLWMFLSISIAGEKRHRE